MVVESLKLASGIEILLRRIEICTLAFADGTESACGGNSSSESLRLFCSTRCSFCKEEDADAGARSNCGCMKRDFGHFELCESRRMMGLVFRLRGFCHMYLIHPASDRIERIQYGEKPLETDKVLFSLLSFGII